MPMMSDQDWQSWRDTARQSTQNLNQVPNVLNPADLSSDRAANTQLMYGAPGNGSGSGDIAQAITRAFRQSFGHSPNENDYAAWLQGAQTHGLNAQEIFNAIAASADAPQNASLHTTAAGSTPATAAGATPGLPGGFATGLMGGAAMQGLTPFNAGMMGFR